MDLTALETDGVLDVRSAARHGVDAAVLRTAVRRGELRRLARGQYTTRTEAEGEEWHLLRTIAHVRAHDGRAAASHHSGCLVHGLPLVHTDLERVRLCRTRDRQRRRRADLAVDPRPCAAVRVSRAGVTTPVLVVPAAVAVVQHGCLAGPGAALVAADAAVRLGRTSTEELREAVALLGCHSGIGPVRAALPVADGRRESPGESLTAWLLAGAGIRTTPQVEVVAAGRLYRLDLVLDDEPVIVEFDGLAKYRTRADLVAEKRREDALRALGYEVVRVTWADLARPAEVLARVEAARRRARGSARRP